VNKEYDYDFMIDFRDESESVTEAEIRLIRAYLPDILKELALLIHQDKD
jgi:hypothetical protein